jgi:DNA-binding transcriptional regulator LsrR (DeoR family)
LSAELCSAFGLKHAFAFNFPDEDEPALRRRLGEAAGEVLMDIITPSDVLGITWARSLSGLAATLTQMPPCPIVQLTGAVPPPDGREPARPCAGRRRIGGGTAHVFYAPMIVDDAQTATVIRRQADVADALALVPSVTITMLAIGAWAPGLSTVWRLQERRGPRGDPRRHDPRPGHPHQPCPCPAQARSDLVGRGRLRRDRASGSGSSGLRPGSCRCTGI